MARKARQRLIGIVDDDRPLRQALALLLRSQGCRVRTYDSAESLLSRGLGHSWHCLIVDLGLPGLSGLELQQKLVEEGHEVPVILVTGQDDPTGALAAQAARQGVRAVLHKPVPSRDLMREIDRLRRG